MPTGKDVGLNFKRGLPWHLGNVGGHQDMTKHFMSWYVNGLYSKSGLCYSEQRVLGHISPEGVSWEERDIFNDLTSLVGQRQITQLEPVYFLSGSITCLDIM